ncbi:hypothetical protein ACS0PU_001398 [Formica fusca]
METKKELRHTAEHLAERYEDINDKQKELAPEEALRLVNYKEPSMTAIERAEAEELKKMNIKIHGMQIRLEQLKKKSIQQIKHADASESSEKRKEIVFTHSQEKVIQETLSQMAKNIKNLMDQAKHIKAEINLSYINKQQ